MYDVYLCVCVCVCIRGTGLLASLHLSRVTMTEQLTFFTTASKNLNFFIFVRFVSFKYLN